MLAGGEGPMTGCVCVGRERGSYDRLCVCVLAGGEGPMTGCVCVGRGRGSYDRLCVCWQGERVL